MKEVKIFTDKIWFTDGKYILYRAGDELPKPMPGVDYVGATSLRPIRTVEQVAINKQSKVKV